MSQTTQDHNLALSTNSLDKATSDFRQVSFFKARRLKLVLLLGATVLALSVGVRAKRPTIMKKDGHLSPIMAIVYFPNNTWRKYMIVDVPGGGPYYYKGKREGATEVKLWLDSMASITDTNDQDALITLKNGSQYRLGWGCDHLQAMNADESVEDINLKKVSAVKFLYTPRRDHAGYAMFDDWRYSPYTGEELPEE